MKKSTLSLLIMLLPALAIASGGEAHGGAHDEAAIPLEQIGWQAANLGFLLIVIFFAAKKSIVDVFVKRQKDYLEQSEKTQTALRAAETALAGIKDKLANLESGEKKSVENAKNEAKTLQENIVKEAQLAADKLKKDVELVMTSELNKAKSEINAAILSQAIASAKKSIDAKGGATSSASEAAFVNQLGQVRT